MPLPKPRGGKKPESKKDFISRCAGDDVANKEFPDQKQRLGYCYTAWERRKAKASYIFSSVDDEYIVVKANMVLPPSMAERIKEMPESGPGYHNVNMKFKNGKSYSGVIKNCDMFETEDDEIESESCDDLDEIEMSDTSYSMKTSTMGEKKVEVEVEIEDDEKEDDEKEDDEKEDDEKEDVMEASAASNEGKTLNKPFRLPKGSSKKFGVYVKNDKGNIVVVKFGDPNLSIKRDNPERRKNFRARHGCDNPGPKWKAKYWACKFWSKKPVSQLTSSVNIDWENLPEIVDLGDFEVIEENDI